MAANTLLYGGIATVGNTLGLCGSYTDANKVVAVDNFRGVRLYNKRMMTVFKYSHHPNFNNLDKLLILKY